MDITYMFVLHPGCIKKIKVKDGVIIIIKIQFKIYVCTILHIIIIISIHQNWQNQKNKGKWEERGRARGCIPFISLFSSHGKSPDKNRK